MIKYLWLFCLIPTLLYGAAGDVASVSGKAVTAISTVSGVAGASIATLCGKSYSDGDATCSVATNELGTRGDGSSNSYAGENVMECNLWEPDCSGKLYTAYLRHRGTGTDYAKVCVYTDDGDSAPDAGDSLLECSGVITGNENEVWESAAMGSNPAVSTGTSYWVCMIGDTSAWNYYYNTGVARKNQTVAGSYASPPSDLTGTWNNSANYQISMYVTVGD